MKKLVKIEPCGRRLKGLDEFEKPDFVGRIARIARWRALMWRAMIGGAILAGAALGLAIS